MERKQKCIEKIVEVSDKEIIFRFGFTRQPSMKRLQAIIDNDDLVRIELLRRRLINFDGTEAVPLNYGVCAVKAGRGKYYVYLAYEHNKAHMN